MKTSINMSDFETCVAAVLNTLYESFPQPKTLDPRKIGRETIIDGNTKHESWEPTGSLHSWDDTSYFFSENKSEEAQTRAKQALLNYEWSIRFLLAEGFVRQVDDFSQSFNLALTAKGLTVLNAVPKVIEGRPFSLIERIKGALVQQSKESLRETITAIISQSVVLATLGS